MIKLSSFDDLAKMALLSHEYWAASVEPAHYSKKSRKKH